MAQQMSIVSPDQSLSVKINISQELSFEVLLNGMTVIDKVIVDMKTSDGRTFGNHAKLTHKKKRFIEETRMVEISHKDKVIKSVFNELKMSFKGNYQLMNV